MAKKKKSGIKKFFGSKIVKVSFETIVLLLIFYISDKVFDYVNAWLGVAIFCSALVYIGYRLFSLWSKSEEKEDAE